MSTFGVVQLVPILCKHFPVHTIGTHFMMYNSCLQSEMLVVAFDVEGSIVVAIEMLVVAFDVEGSIARPVSW